MGEDRLRIETPRRSTAETGGAFGTIEHDRTTPAEVGLAKHDLVDRRHVAPLEIAA